MWRVGALAKEDISKFCLYREKIENLSDSELSQFCSKVLNSVNNIVGKKLVNSKRIGDFVYYSSKNLLTKTLLKIIKLEYFKFKAAQASPVFQKQKNIILPYVNKQYNELNINRKPILYRENDNIFIHPRDKLRSIIGETLMSDANKFKLYNDFIKKKEWKLLIAQKKEIINNIQAYKISSIADNDFKYTKEDIENLKKLAIKYDMINSCLENKGIYTKDIETVIYSNLQPNIGCGDVLPNGDIVLSCGMTYDLQKKFLIPSLITFANTNRGYRFKMYSYNGDAIAKIPAYKKQFEYFTRLENFDAIDLLNQRAAEYINGTEIAEVYAELLGKHDMTEKMKKSQVLPNAKIEELLNYQQKFLYIKNLKNFDIKKFFNVALPLINCLKEFCLINKINKAFLEAECFNNVKHSPVFLYLKVGCKPIFYTKEEMEKELHTGFDYKKNVWFTYEI